MIAMKSKPRAVFLANHIDVENPKANQNIGKILGKNGKYGEHV